MSTDLTMQTDAELELCESIRRAALTEIDLRGMSEAQLANVLGMPNLGAYLLLQRQSWPLELGYRVAEALGLKVVMTIDSSEVADARAA